MDDGPVNWDIEEPEMGPEDFQWPEEDNQGWSSSDWDSESESEARCAEVAQEPSSDIDSDGEVDIQ